MYFADTSFNVAEWKDLYKFTCTSKCSLAIGLLNYMKITLLYNTYLPIFGYKLSFSSCESVKTSGLALTADEEDRH